MSLELLNLTMQRSLGPQMRQKTPTKAIYRTQQSRGLAMPNNLIILVAGATFWEVTDALSVGQFNVFKYGINVKKVLSIFKAGSAPKSSKIIRKFRGFLHS